MATQVRKTARWAAPPLVLAVVLGLTVGFLPLWLLYWLLNAVGVWLYCDENGRRNLATQRWLKRLSLVLLPSGFYGLMAGGGTLSPGQSVSVGSRDDLTRTESARASGNMAGPRH